jgi:hypothetical protein
MATKHRHYHIWFYLKDARGRRRKLQRGRGFKHRSTANKALKTEHGAGLVLRCSDPTCTLDKRFF